MDDTYSGTPTSFLPNIPSPQGFGVGPAGWLQGQQYNQQMADYTKQAALQNTIQGIAAQKAQLGLGAYQQTLPGQISADNATNAATAASAMPQKMGLANQAFAKGQVDMGTAQSDISTKIAQNAVSQGQAGIQELDQAVGLAARVQALQGPDAPARVGEIAQSMGIPANSPIIAALQKDPQGTAQHLAGAKALVTQQAASPQTAGTQPGSVQPSYAETVSRVDPAYFQKKTLQAQQEAADYRTRTAVAGTEAGATTQSAQIRADSDQKVATIQASAQKNLEATAAQASSRITADQKAGKQPDPADVNEFNNAVAQIAYMKKVQVMTQQAGTASMAGMQPPADVAGPPPGWQGQGTPPTAAQHKVGDTVPGPNGVSLTVVGPGKAVDPKTKKTYTFQDGQ